MKIWCVKRTVYSVESKLIHLFNLLFLTIIGAIPWGTRPVTSQLVILVTNVKSLDFDLITDILKEVKRKGEKKRKIFRLNKRFRSWKQICEALLRVQGFH